MTTEASGDDGERRALLVGDVYDTLRGIAARVLAKLPCRLEPTDLVHEAMIDLLRRWNDLPRHELLALCATMMRRIAVDEARRQGVRGGAQGRVTLTGVAADEANLGPLDLLDLDAALRDLEAYDPRWAKIVELRYFGGLSGDQVADLLGLSRKTIVRDWALARAWLKQALER